LGRLHNDATLHVHKVGSLGGRASHLVCNSHVENNYT
jgi:hypothetical protein